MAISSNFSRVGSPTSLRFGMCSGVGSCQSLFKLGLALVTAALWSLALPGLDLGWLGWIAFVPLTVPL